MKDNLFLIISEDDNVINYNLKEIFRKINKDDSDKINYDSDNNLIEILDEACTPSMFSPYKILTCNNFSIDKINENELEYLERYIKGKNKNVYIIFITSNIDQRKKIFKTFKDNFTIINDDKIDSKNLSTYINNYLDKNNFKISSYDLEYFLNKVGVDINNINNELDKLMIYKSNDKIILKNDIDLLISDNIDNVIYEWTNAFFDKDYNKVIKMYDKFKKDNISIDYLISSLYGSIRTNLIIKLLNNQGKSNLDIAKYIGKKEYFVKKSLERLYNFSIYDLTSYIDKLSLVEQRFKSGISHIDEFALFLLN